MNLATGSQRLAPPLAETPGPAPERAPGLAVARALAVFTIVYNLAEGVVAIAAGAAADSVALIGFGLDSGIECAAAAIVWRRAQIELAQGSGAHTIVGELRARQWIGVTFLLLAAYVVTDAAWGLGAGTSAPSRVGIALAAISLLVMPPLALWKLRVADRLRSAALRAEARETVACSYLSFTLLLGLGANQWLGWAWADGVAALAMAPWLVWEGVQGLRGEGCCGE